MRITAAVSAVLSLIALILGFLTLFAGHTPSFMPTYSLVTMNSSRIGYSLFNTSQSSSNPFISFLDNITNTIEGDIEGAVNSLARDFGLHDFYTIHLLDYCEGYYTPSPLPNATLKASGIHMNVTSCNSTSHVLGFEPSEVLQAELDKAGLGIISLDSLDWPAALDADMNNLRKATNSVVGFYSAFIAFTGIALISTTLAIFLTNKHVALANVIIFVIASQLGTISSSFVTYYAEQGAKIINDNVGSLDVVAYSGAGIQGLSWAATGAVMLASLLWSVDCCLARRRRKREQKQRYNDMSERLRIAEMNQKH